jgi:hypothetical protein
MNTIENQAVENHIKYTCIFNEYLQRLRPKSIEAHCKEEQIHVQYRGSRIKVRGLVRNVHIHASVSNLSYCPRSGHLVCCSNVGIGNEAAQFNFWEYGFKFSAQCLCSASVSLVSFQIIFIRMSRSCMKCEQLTLQKSS